MYFGLWHDRLVWCDERSWAWSIYVHVLIAVCTCVCFFICVESLRSECTFWFFILNELIAATHDK